MHVVDIVLDQVARRGPVSAREISFNSFFEVNQVLIGIKISQGQGLIKMSEVISKDPELQTWVLAVS